MNKEPVHLGVESEPWGMLYLDNRRSDRRRWRTIWSGQAGTGSAWSRRAIAAKRRPSSSPDPARSGAEYSLEAAGPE